MRSMIRRGMSLPLSGFACDVSPVREPCPEPLPPEVFPEVLPESPRSPPRFTARPRHASPDGRSADVEGGGCTVVAGGVDGRSRSMWSRQLPPRSVEGVSPGG
jgi:hypothetical protein